MCVGRAAEAAIAVLRREAERDVDGRLAPARGLAVVDEWMVDRHLAQHFSCRREHFSRGHGIFVRT